MTLAGSGREAERAGGSSARTACTWGCRPVKQAARVCSVNGLAKEGRHALQSALFTLAEALAWHLEIARDRGRPAARAAGGACTRSDGPWPREARAPIFDFQAPDEVRAFVDQYRQLGRDLRTSRSRDGAGGEFFLPLGDPVP